MMHIFRALEGCRRASLLNVVVSSCEAAPQNEARNREAENNQHFFCSTGFSMIPEKHDKTAHQARPASWVLRHPKPLKKRSASFRSLHAALQMSHLVTWFVSTVDPRQFSRYSWFDLRLEGVLTTPHLCYGKNLLSLLLLWPCGCVDVQSRNSTSFSTSTIPSLSLVDLSGRLLSWVLFWFLEQLSFCLLPLQPQLLPPSIFCCEYEIVSVFHSQYPAGPQQATTAWLTLFFRPFFQWLYLFWFGIKFKNLHFFFWCYLLASVILRFEFFNLNDNLGDFKLSDFDITFLITQSSPFFNDLMEGRH